MIALLCLVLQGRDLIDTHIRRAWTAADVVPAPKARDFDFLRRVYLDILGTVPTLEDVEAFKGDRAGLIDSLLERDAYARNWSQIWSAAILGVGDVRMQEDVAAKLPRALEPYFKANLPLDAFARAVMSFTTPPPADHKKERDGLSLFYSELFLRAQMESPQFLAGRFARAFLGLQIQCARCHDHPFDRWTQEEFYGMAAFFGGATHQVYGVGERPPGHIKALAIPGSKEPPIVFSYLDSHEKPQPGETPRAAIARILTADAQFARASVNRVWANFFGRGFVMPLDGFGIKGKPTHPELLRELAAEFQARRYDLKWLIREICNSEAYQLSARVASRDPGREKLYAMAIVRPLRPEQIVDSILTVKGLGEKAPRDRYLREYRRILGYTHGSPGTAFQGGIPSALLMLNGDLAAEGFQKWSGTLDRLYQAVLCRPIRPEDYHASLEYGRLTGRGWDGLISVLMNTSEFLFNR